MLSNHGDNYDDDDEDEDDDVRGPARGHSGAFRAATTATVMVFNSVDAEVARNEEKLACSPNMRSSHLN